MASATDQGDKQMTDEEKGERDEKSIPYRPAVGSEVPKDKSGFFHIYKSGQGYWTRMLTAGGLGLITIFVAQFLYQQLPTLVKTLQDHRGLHLGIVVGVVLGIALLGFLIMNKPRNADFLIATDSEMKKVNWTSRKELIGSTKVVVFFLLFVTLLLFVTDLAFGWVFHQLKILEVNPLDAFFHTKK
jgi:preprotein translocase subunit SecE